MQNPENPMTENYQNHLDASRQLAQTVLSCTEKIDHTLFQTAQELFLEQTRFAQALVNTRDPKQIILLQSSFFSHTPECVTQSQKNILQICQEMQDQFGKTMEQYFEHASHGPLLPIPGAVSGEKSSADFMAPISDLFNVWSKAFQQASTLATHNLEVASNNSEKDKNTIAEPGKAASHARHTHNK